MMLAGSSDEDILVIKVRTKRRKRPRTWSLRFDLLKINMCAWDNKPWKLVLRCRCLTFMNHDVLFGDDREIFATIKEDNLEFYLMLLRLQSKIALCSRSPPASNHFKWHCLFFSLRSPRTQGLKKCSSFRIAFVLLQTSANSFLGCFGGFSKLWLTTVFGLLALQVCCTWYVDMCFNNGLSLASIISGFGFFCCCCFLCCVLMKIFLFTYLGLKC